MTLAAWNILAQDDGDHWSSLLYLAVLAILWLGGLIARWIRQKQERQAEMQRRRERTAEPPQAKTPSPPQPRLPQPTPAEQAVEAMRRAIQQRSAVRRPAPPPPPRRAVAAPAPPRPAPPEQLTQRHVVPSATGGEIEQEILRLRRRLEQAEGTRRQRLQEHVGTLGGVAAAETDAGEGLAPTLQIDLLDNDAARRGIVYAEVLGPPLALRDQPPGWREL